MADNATIATLKLKVAEATQKLVEAKDSEWWSVHSAMTISTLVLLFGVSIMGLAVVLIVKHSKIEDQDVKLFVVPLVIFASLFLVVAGYSDSQIAPAMGLLGTIVGYTLGSNSNVNKQQQQLNTKYCPTCGKENG